MTSGHLKSVSISTQRSKFWADSKIGLKKTNIKTMFDKNSSKDIIYTVMSDHRESTKTN